jgi:hypothetical protein
MSDDHKVKYEAPSGASWHYWLSTFAENEVRYVESSMEDVFKQMEAIQRSYRLKRSAKMREMAFELSVYTAIRSDKFNEIRAVIRVERKK